MDGPDFDASQDIYAHFDVTAGCAVPVVTKNAFRLAIKPRIAMGNHTMYYPGLSLDRCLVAAEAGACLIHLPYRSETQVRSKILNGGSAYRATNLNERLGAHGRRPYEALMQDGDVILQQELGMHQRRVLNGAASAFEFFF
jgi:hypothetical protein